MVHKCKFNLFAASPVAPGRVACAPEEGLMTDALHERHEPPLAEPPPVVLTIAGFDPSSGAGITADLQVFAAFGLFGTACITSLTAQSTRGVQATYSVSSFIDQTLAELQADVPPVGVKIGMLGDALAVRATCDYLRRWREARPANAPVAVVLDPVLLSSSGAPLLAPDAVQSLRDDLLPLVDWITPNLDELQVLAGAAPHEGTAAAFERMHRLAPHLHIVATGGEQTPPDDLLLTPSGGSHRFPGIHVDTTSTHGTGCAFSSALLCRLVLGDAPAEAVAAAKAYVTEALRQAPGVGTGRGPLGLLWPRKGAQE